MISKLIDYFFPVRKTMLQLAKEAILKQDIIICNGEMDIMNGSFFIVGKMIPNKMGLKLDSLTILFNRENTIVIIKQNDVVIYYFSTEDECQQIRGILAVLSINNNKRIEDAKQRSSVS